MQPWGVRYESDVVCTECTVISAYWVLHGYKRILSIANDTDIIVLGISFFSDTGADKLWVSFGIGNKLRNISINDICSTMSSAKAKALPAFHALTGSNNTSFFSGYAKWSTRPELTTTLCHPMDKPETPSSDDIAAIESFVISLYSVSFILTDVNQARQQIFAQSSRTFEYLPPTKAALVENVKERHTKRDMCGANPSSLSKCCLARASGGGSNQKRQGTILNRDPSSRQSHECVD